MYVNVYVFTYCNTHTHTAETLSFNKRICIDIEKILVLNRLLSPER